jgi:L-fucose isomerase-like protein
MAQYRFHISDSEVAFFDDNGIDLPMPPATFDEATATAWVLMYELADEISDWSDWRVDVVDENDSVVLVLPFEQVLRTTKAQPADLGSMRTMR